ncbi:MAG: AAA family ATPase [Pseudomonadota bacterium]|nr:AAA family ATPase [Pseudomonadota bacterium]
MIINSLWAENVLKYSLLDLQEIPERGLIAVIGDNESGKSTIGESICFALFGRTFSLDTEDLDKLIRWGESRCSIKLEFTTPDGQRYQVARFLDEQGNHDASISRAGESPMIHGVEDVAAALEDIIGFGYTEFIESFYLAQREITTPHPHSHAVKAMAGVEALEKVAERCRQEIEQARKLAVEAKAEHADIQGQIDALDLKEGHLESLQQRRKGHEDALPSNRAHITGLQAENDEGDRLLGRLQDGSTNWLGTGAEASFKQRKEQEARLKQLLAELSPGCREDRNTTAPFSALSDLAADVRGQLAEFGDLSGSTAGYREQLERLLGQRDDTPLKDGEQAFGERNDELLAQEEEQGARRRTANRLSWLFLILALAAWILTGLLGLAPDSSQAQPASWLPELDPQWRTQLQPWFIFGAGTLTALFLVFAGRSIMFGSRLKQLAGAHELLLNEQKTAAAELRTLARLDDMPMSEAVSSLGALSDETLAAHSREFAQSPAAVLMQAEEYEHRRSGFKDAQAALEGGFATSKQARLQKVEGLEKSVTGHSDKIARLDGEIPVEQERVHRHLELSAIAGNLQSSIDELHHRIEVRELSIELTKGAVYYISQRFNTEVRNLAADSLPKFTNERYEHLQIDENLKVNAFSNEKRNFMDLDEISSGTQRQIMLAVRLALSQKLVNSVIQGAQMLFLDEPFAFFDEPRTASALAVLPQVSGDFTQIWVTSQTFPEQSRFDLYVQCEAADNLSPMIKKRAQETSSGNR